MEIGSVTKVFTGTILADAVTRGALKLGDDVSLCLPSGTKLPGSITLAQLATHTSGLPRLGDLPMAHPNDPYADFAVPQLYAALRTAALGPATYDYSNLGVTLLGHALGECAHKSYGEMVAQLITGPLGMKHTGLDAPLAAAGHDFNGAQAVPWKMPLPAAGGLRSNADDLLRFVAAQLDPPPSLRAAIMLTHEERAKRPGGAIALGWHIGLPGLPDVLWHNGETGSFHAFLAFDRARKLGVVLLADTALPIFDEAGIALLHQLRGEPAPPPLIHVAVAVEKMALLIGSYSFGASQLQVTRRDRQLWVEISGQDPFRAWPVADNVFEIPLFGARFTFTPTAAPSRWCRTA